MITRLPQERVRSVQRLRGADWLDWVSELDKFKKDLLSVASWFLEPRRPRPPLRCPWSNSVQMGIEHCASHFIGRIVSANGFFSRIRRGHCPWLFDYFFKGSLHLGWLPSHLIMWFWCVSHSSWWCILHQLVLLQKSWLHFVSPLLYSLPNVLQPNPKYKSNLIVIPDWKCLICPSFC